MGRSPCCNEAGLKKGAWTADEDRMLIAHIRKYGEGGWRTLPQKAGIQRCGKSCRLRWVNYLRPDIKRGEFGPDEEKKIVELHATLGNKWSAIARQLPGRTDNEIKNHWNTHLKKRLAENRDSNHVISNGQLAGPPPSSSNNDSKNVVRLSHEARQGRSVSSLARLLNKVATKLGPMQSNKMATNLSTEANFMSAARTILSKSTTGNPGDGLSNDDGDTSVKSSQSLSVLPDGPSEMLSRVSLSTPTRIVNKMATKLAPSSIDALKDRLGAFPDCMSIDRKDGDITNCSETKTCSYNNTESSISTSTVWKANTPTSSVFDCESSDQLTGILSMCENEINEAFTALNEATVFDQPQVDSTMYVPEESACESSEVLDIMGTCEGEAGGAAFPNVSEHMVFDSHGVTDMEGADNTCNEVMGGCRKLAFGGPNNQEYTKTLSNDSDRFGGDGEINSGASDYFFDFWDDGMHVEDYSWPRLQK